ncbi:hypothetical protein [Asticcacaulis sp.]|uniref:hypothetical protein n=1 Tax=Asticcacaulis sp. TaxID=1872648 RepID=UPI002C634FE8|nr:hypothetical protein [Asticcacaulis sp.]HTM83279.1 hypothetical protein [Asticcacaulis sp.]
MVKIKRGDLDPKAFTHTLKGFYVKTWLGRPIVARSPRFGPRNGKASVWNRNQFTIAARMAASPVWLDQVAAMGLSRGTEQVPRDILMMAAYGNLFSIEFPDGSTTTVADHNYQPPAPAEELTSMLVSTMYDAAYTQSSTSTTQDTLGSIIGFPEATKIRGVGVVAAQSVSWIGSIILAKIDASLVITEILAEGPQTSMPSIRKLLWLPVELDLEAGDQIAVILRNHTDPFSVSFFAPMIDLPHLLFPLTAVRTIRANADWTGVGTAYSSITAGAAMAVSFKIVE